MKEFFFFMGVFIVILIIYAVIWEIQKRFKK